MKKKKNKNKNNSNNMKSSFDTQGSWTGNYYSNEYEKPVQDVDDL